MYTIYHNPRCKKSRAGLAFLEEKNKKYNTRLYLKDPLTKEELNDLIEQSDLSIDQLIRKQEKYYKENIKGKNLNKDQIIDEILNEPKLLQRPIISDGKKAVLADPPEKATILD